MFVGVEAVEDGGGGSGDDSDDGDGDGDGGGDGGGGGVLTGVDGAGELVWILESVPPLLVLVSLLVGAGIGTELSEGTEDGDGAIVGGELTGGTDDGGEVGPGELLEGGDDGGGETGLGLVTTVELVLLGALELG